MASGPAKVSNRALEPIYNFESMTGNIDTTEEAPFHVWPYHPPALEVSLYLHSTLENSEIRLFNLDRREENDGLLASYVASGWIGGSH